MADENDQEIEVPDDAIDDLKPVEAEADAFKGGRTDTK